MIFIKNGTVNTVTKGIINSNILIDNKKIIEIGNEIETKINMPKDTMASIWFYTICYKVTYNDKDYHILKIANKINDESIIKPVSDGIIEIRIQSTK